MNQVIPYTFPMTLITVPTSVVAPQSDRPLTPAMTATLWQIAARLDEMRIPATVENSEWVEIPTKRLRGEGARSDNRWLDECLRRLQRIELSGKNKGQPWGATLVAEWAFYERGSMVKILIPPSAVFALRSSETFAKIEEQAAYRMKGSARRLYAILADKKRQRRPYWSFSLEDLRTQLGLSNRKSYERWQDFKRWILLPALEEINDFGTVSVKMTPEKVGRSVSGVRFDWQWKSLDEIRETTTENEKHSTARKKSQDTDTAPPLIEKENPHPHLEWWELLGEDARNSWADKVGRTIEAGGRSFPRKKADIALEAFEVWSQEKS